MSPDGAAGPDLADAPSVAEDIDVALMTVPVLARLRSDAPTEQAAVADVRQRLGPVRGLFDDCQVERREQDGYFWVMARFVTVSVDVHTAVVGVHETLVDAGITADEVWAHDGLSATGEPVLGSTFGAWSDDSL